MWEIIEIVVGIVMCVLLGLICTFFMYLNTIKDELWEEIHKRWKDE